MSTYKKNNAGIDIGGFTNCPDFLERYLIYRQTFTDTKAGSVVDMFTVLREFCQYFHFKQKLLCEPSTKDAHKDMDVRLMQVHEICQVTQEDMERYLCFLENKVRNSNTTIRKKLNFIKNFYLYLEKNAADLEISLPHGNPARFLDVPQTAVAKPFVLTSAQVEKLANSTTGENTLRDKAIILLLATTGILTTELINLNRGDVREDTLLIRSPNGNRTVFLTNACETALRRYLRETREYDDPGYPIFVNAATGSRLTARAIQLRIEKAAGVAGFGNKNITARVLRNTAAFVLFRSCGEEKQADVRKYMGIQTKSGMRNLANSAVHGIDAQTLNASPLGSIGSKKKEETT